MTLPLATLRADPANLDTIFVRAGDRVIGIVTHLDGRGWWWSMAEGTSAMGCYWASPEEAAECVAAAWGTQLAPGGDGG